MVSNTHLHEIVKPMYNLAFIISDGRAYLGIYKNYFNLLFFFQTILLINIPEIPRTGFCVYLYYTLHSGLS